MSGGVPLPVAHLWGRARHPVVRASWAVWVVRGTPHQPHCVRSCELALRAVGLAGGRPPGMNAMCRCGGCPRSGARPPPAARPQGGLSESATNLLWARACGRGGPVLSFWLACPAGAACRGGPPSGGWPSYVTGGVWCQALALSRLPVPGGGEPGPVARVSRAPMVWVWASPSIGPTARGLASRRCALWRWREDAPWGGALRRCEGRLRSEARPPPAGRPQGGLSGSATHVLWAQACGRGGPALSLWLACPAGGLPMLRGASGVRCCPSPGRPSLGAGGQDLLPVCPRPGCCGHVGPSTGPTACALASQRCALWGWREGIPLGGALRRCEGRLS